MNVRGGRRLARVAGSLVFLLAANEALLRSGGTGALVVDIGPSTSAYLTGVLPSEEQPPLTFRWTRPRARVRVPLLSSGGNATLRLRYARFVDAPARIRLGVGGSSATFLAQPGRFRVQSFRVALPPDTPFELSLEADDDGATGLGLALDWIEVEGTGWRPTGSLLAPRLLPAGVFLLSCLAGMRLMAATASGLTMALLGASWLACDPFAFAHVAGALTLPGLGLGAAVLVFLRRARAPRVLLLLFLGSFLLKGAGVFHPRYFYPDVRNHGRYIQVFRSAPGGWVQRGITAQKAVRTAYPRSVAGKPYVFPYSPLFFVPFSYLPPGREIVEAALKYVALALATLQVLLVFTLGRELFGVRSGVAAALVSVFLPPLFSRLLLAMYPTIAGHICDLAAVLMAARLVAQPRERRHLWRFAAASWLAFVTYITSLLNLSLLAATLALMLVRDRWRILAASAAAALLAVGLLYSSFAVQFVTEILPALFRGGAPGPGPDPEGGLLQALGRIHLFYGVLAPLLALGGFVLAWRWIDPARMREQRYPVPSQREQRYPVPDQRVQRCLAPNQQVLVAYGLAFLLLILMRGLGGGLFKDLKEMVFVSPLVAVTAGASLEELWGRKHWGRPAAAALTLALAAFGLFRGWGWLARHTLLVGL